MAIVAGSFFFFTFAGSVFIYIYTMTRQNQERGMYATRRLRVSAVHFKAARSLSYLHADSEYSDYIGQMHRPI